MHKKFGMNYMRYLSIQLLFLLFIYPISVFALTAEQAVEETTYEVLDRLQQDKARLEVEPDYIKTIVRELIIPHFDFNTMSRLVLEDHWETVSKPEQDCFLDGFRNKLIERYAYILMSYDNQAITFQVARPVGELDVVTVEQTITRSGAEPLPINYPMRYQDNEWKVVDLVVDGISLLKSYRGTYQREIDAAGLQNFIHGFQECQD